jgi:hypothetical protein
MNFIMSEAEGHFLFDHDGMGETGVRFRMSISNLSHQPRVMLGPPIFHRDGRIS